MVQKANLNLKIVKRFREKIGRTFKIDKIVLFGSRANGTFNEQSDFDILLISKDFKKIQKHKRAIIPYLKWNEKYPLELLCLTPEEFEAGKKEPWGIIAEALKTGITA